MADVREGGGAEGEDGRANVDVGDYLDAEDVGEAGAAVGAVGAEDEVLAFLVEDEDAGDHGGRVVGRVRKGRGCGSG